MHPAWISRVEISRKLSDDWKTNQDKILSPLQKLRHDLTRAWWMYCASRNYDLVYVGSGWDGLFFSIGQRLFRRNKVPHIFIDFYVNIDQNRIEKGIRRFLYHLAVQGACKVLVQRHCEVELFARALSIPPDKFVFVRYHSTLYDVPYTVQNDDYIFAGGDSDRDYPLLIEAVRGLPYRTVIACLRRDHFRKIVIPANVEIRTTPQDEFFQLMAGARVTVVPLRSRPQHVGGEQTYANAMSMGKPTIVTDLYASDYIQHGVTGILTPPGDGSALRRAIKHVMENPEQARLMGLRAKETSKAFAPEQFFAAIFRISEECTGKRFDR
jgi:glycosyltransferase involved in cell wall biosynthesis